MRLCTLLQGGVTELGVCVCVGTNTPRHWLNRLAQLFDYIIERKLSACTPARANLIDMRNWYARARSAGSRGNGGNSFKTQTHKHGQHKSLSILESGKWRWWHARILQCVVFYFWSWAFLCVRACAFTRLKVIINALHVPATLTTTNAVQQNARTHTHTDVVTALAHWRRSSVRCDVICLQQSVERARAQARTIETP